MVKKVMERKLMIHSLSENIADFLLSKDCFEKENLDIYVYGTELILSTALGIIIVSILSIVFNCKRVPNRHVIFLHVTNGNSNFSIFLFYHVVFQI